MKTMTLIPPGSVLRFQLAVAMTFAVLNAVLLGGISVKAATTNYYWNNTSSDYYTNDMNWAGGVAPMGLNNTFGPSGSTILNAYVTNGGTILYGDGGGGS